MQSETELRNSGDSNHLAKTLGNVTFENNEEFGRILNDFCIQHAQSFVFPELSTEDKRKISDLFVRKLQSSQPPPNIHKLCLSALRILSRDTKGIREFETPDMFAALRYHARLQLRPETKNLVHYPTEAQACENILEAQKVIFNLIYNSSSFRGLCAEGDFIQCLFIRMSLYKSELCRMSTTVKSFDTKMFFLLTAQNDRARQRARDEFRGIETLFDVLSQLIQPEGAMFGTQPLNENDCDLCCEILKSLYTLTMDWGDGKVYEDDPVTKEAFLKITPTLIDLIKSRCIVKDKTYEVKSNLVNFLINYPVTLYSSLAPFCDSSDVSSEPEKNGCTGAYSITVKCKGPSFIGSKANTVYQEHDMTVVNEILDFLNNRLDLFSVSSNSYKQQAPKIPVTGGLKETLSPVLCLLQNMAKYNRYIRRYLKVSILPPLEAKTTRNFTQLPEEGRLLRNKLVRLMTSPVSEVKELVAELVFIICKESVARMIKYTGYGNAAGLLARKGLMGVARAPRLDVDPDYSEDSEDSDTEEYKAVKDDINPVTGRLERNKPNPMDEMTEEQKEYEALELAKLLGRICNNGVIQPAVINEDGRPVRVEHIMQLREMADANNNANSDSESDDES